MLGQPSDAALASTTTAKSEASAASRGAEARRLEGISNRELLPSAVGQSLPLQQQQISQLGNRPSPTLDFRSERSAGVEAESLTVDQSTEGFRKLSREASLDSESTDTLEPRYGGGRTQARV